MLMMDQLSCSPRGAFGSTSPSPAVFARPRRCAQRLAVNSDKTSGFDASDTTNPLVGGIAARSPSPSPLLNPVRPQQSASLPQMGLGGAVTSPPFQMKSVPRCLSKIGPKPTTLEVPSSFEESRQPLAPPKPPISREERDAKHKLMVLLWESLRYQRRQMLSSRSSTASSTCRSPSAFTSGGNTPVSMRHSPSCHPPLSPGTFPQQHQRHHGPNGPALTIDSHSPTLGTPIVTTNAGGSASSSSSLNNNNGTSIAGDTASLLSQPHRIRLGFDDKPAPYYATPLLVPKPGAAPKDGEDIVPLPPPSLSELLAAQQQAATTLTSAANNSTTPDYHNADAHAIANGLFVFDDVDAENRAVQQGLDKLSSQWRNMVGQLDHIWDSVEGDIEMKYHKLKLRITSMLLWERLDVHRNMLTPPMEAIRQMNDEHERRLSSLPRGTLFHNSPPIASTNSGIPEMLLSAATTPKAGAAAKTLPMPLRASLSDSLSPKEEVYGTTRAAATHASPADHISAPSPTTPDYRTVDSAVSVPPFSATCVPT